MIYIGRIRAQTVNHISKAVVEGVVSSYFQKMYLIEENTFSSSLIYKYLWK